MPGPTTVKTPMQGDLDANTNAIRNASSVEAGTVTGTVGLYSGDFTPGGAHGTVQLHAGDGSGPSIYAGTADPTGLGGGIGSLYLRTDGTHWCKTATGWRQLAFV